MRKRNRQTAGLLGIFLGMFGVHNFYLGNKKRAIIQLAITVASAGVLFWVSSLWGLIEGLMLLTGDMKVKEEA